MSITLVCLEIMGREFDNLLFRSIISALVIIWYFMFGKRDRKGWQSMERDLAAFDRQNNLKRNRKFEAQVSPKVIELVEAECYSIRRQIMMSALTPFTGAFYERIRRLYEEIGDSLHLIQAVDFSETPEDWMDLLFILDQLDQGGDSKAGQLANYICGYMKIAKRKVAFEEAAKKSYTGKYQSVELYLNRIHADRDILKQRLDIYLKTSEYSPNLDIVLIDAVEAIFMDEEDEDSPVGERLTVDAKTARALIEKLEIFDELESRSIAKLLDFIPNKDYWKAYFVRNVTRRKEAKNRIFDSSFDSVISKLVGVLGEHALFNFITDDELCLTLEKVKAMQRLSRENFSRLNEDEIMEVVFAAKRHVQGMSRGPRQQYQVEAAQLEIYLTAILKKNFAYLQKTGLSDAFRRGNATFDLEV